MSQDKPNYEKVDGADLLIAIVAASYNQVLVDALIKQATKGLKAGGVKEANLRLVKVPGSGEIPYVTNMLALSGDYDCIIGLGVVVAGDTPHHEIIAHSTAKAMQDVALRSEVPVINGIVVTNTRQQAEERCTGDLDRGTEFAQAALIMAQHRLQLGERLDQVEAEERAKNGGHEPFAQN
jgi:6,7-dimethyl-8-ribityllumazine synthase